MFKQYLTEVDHKYASGIISYPVKLHLPWSTSSSTVDNGIYCMRHMETYLGQEVYNWESGFNNKWVKDKNVLDRLRAKYATKILLSDYNLHRLKIIPLIVSFSVTPESVKTKRKKMAKRIIPSRMEYYKIKKQPGKGF